MFQTPVQKLPKEIHDKCSQIFVHKEIFRRQKVNQVLIYKREKNLNLQVVTWIVVETVCMSDFTFQLSQLVVELT